MATRFEYKDFETLSYPDDLASRPHPSGEGFDYPDCIRFGVRKRIGVSIENVVSAAKSSGQLIKGRFKQAYKDAGIAESVVKNELNKEKYQNMPAQQAQMEVASALIADKKFKNEKVSDRLIDVIADATALVAKKIQDAQKETRALSSQSQTSNELGAIYMNMPQALAYNEDADWSGQELGVAGKMVKNVVAGEGTGGMAAGAAAGSMGNILGAGIGGIGALAGRMGIQGGLFGMAVGAMAAGTPIQKGAEAAISIAQNPYMEMMFSGIGFRQFQFDFKFHPKSSTEQETVHNIIKMFRLNSRPTYVEGEFGKSFMNYPMEWNIQFLTKTVAGKSGRVAGESSDVWNKNSSIPMLKPCVCGNVTTNYTPDNMWSAHNGGRPNTIQLSLTFKETELVMAEDLVSEEAGAASDYEPYGGF